MLQRLSAKARPVPADFHWLAHAVAGDYIDCHFGPDLPVHHKEGLREAAHRSIDRLGSEFPTHVRNPKAWLRRRLWSSLGDYAEPIREQVSRDVVEHRDSTPPTARELRELASGCLDALDRVVLATLYQQEHEAIARTAEILDIPAREVRRIRDGIVERARLVPRGPVRLSDARTDRERMAYLTSCLLDFEVFHEARKAVLHESLRA